VHPESAHSVAFSPDGHSIATTSLDDNIVRQWDMGSGMLMREYKDDQVLVKDVTFSHSGKQQLTADKVRVGDLLPRRSHQLRAP